MALTATSHVKVDWHGSGTCREFAANRELEWEAFEASSMLQGEVSVS